jgi:hypothetical protein
MEQRSQEQLTYNFDHLLTNDDEYNKLNINIDFLIPNDNKIVEHKQEEQEEHKHPRSSHNWRNTFPPAF